MKDDLDREMRELERAVEKIAKEVGLPPAPRPPFPVAPFASIGILSLSGLAIGLCEAASVGVRVEPIGNAVSAVFGPGIWTSPYCVAWYLLASLGAISFIVLGLRRRGRTVIR